MRLQVLTISLAFFATPSFATIYYAGVNEAGGEFGIRGAKGTGLPGRFGVDYAFLNTSTVQTWLNNGINTFRVPFLLERMCPLATGLGGTFNETYYQEYQTAIDFITNAGAYAIIDPHNYMRYNDPSNQPASGSIIGSTADASAATTAEFQAFWTELAHRFVSNPKVIFAIMNEPHDMSTSLLLTNNQAAINGIRSTGSTHMILAPGNGYTGGHAWTTDAEGDQPSSSYMYKLNDTANNLAIDIHEYLDYDFSGTHQACNQSYATNMASLTSWLQEYNLKAFVTEFGGDNATSCTSLLTDAVHYMNENPEYIGWTMWAAGPLWNTGSPCCNDEKSLGSLEPGTHASGNSLSMYNTVWLPVIQPILPTSALKHSGISSISG